MTTYGPGGPTSSLRQIKESDCALGCRNCIEGTICPFVALPAPIVCEAGTYIPNSASALSECYECERCCKPILCVSTSHRNFSHGSPTHRMQWQVPDGGGLHLVQCVRPWHFCRGQRQNCLQCVCCGWILRGGWGKQRGSLSTEASFTERSTAKRPQPGCLTCRISFHLCFSLRQAPRSLSCASEGHGRMWSASTPAKVV